jgi:hypothetical protein
VTDAGYSGTPLGKKLGYRDGMRVFVDGMPEPIRHAIEKSIDPRPDWQLVPGPGLEAAHIFVTTRTALEAKIQTLLPLLKPSGVIWVSWPKRAAKVPTDITEDAIRKVVLPMGLVDVKVCAVDATWSGLKLMIRKELRAL